MRELRSGTPDTNRTCDLSLRRGLLYPLSYRGPAAILAAGLMVKRWSAPA